jgi:stress-induced morphogen
MPLDAQTITQRISSALPDAQIDLVDLAGDNDHWQVTVTSAAFAGVPKVGQHKMVYAAFGAEMGTTLHALSVKTIAK